jgi:general secretion pathway protein D
VSSLHKRGLLRVAKACVSTSLYLVLVGCVTSSGAPTASLAPDDTMASVRNADFGARFPLASEGDSGRSRESSLPLIFPGSDTESEPQRGRDPDMRTASLQQAAFVRGDGVEMNFDGADVQTVAKSLLGDILQLNFVVDPRVQGNVTLTSAGPIPRKDVLPAFESVLRMSNAAIVHSGNLVKIVPIPEAAGGGISVGAGEPGFGVSLVHLQYTSASTVAKTAESFLSRPGAIRVVPSRNLLLIQGTTAERQAALDAVATFDVEWLQNQSVGVYPLKSTSPETMIGELERIFETNEGGSGQGIVRFQPVSRMNAVMVVTKNPKLLTQTTQWIARLDRSDTTGTTLRTFRLKNGNATQVAKILNDIFGGQRSGATALILSIVVRLPEARRRQPATDPTIMPPIRLQPLSRRSRIARMPIRTQPAVPPPPRAETRNAERSRICVLRPMPSTMRSSSTPIKRTIGSSSGRYAISTGRKCR